MSLMKAKSPVTLSEQFSFSAEILCGVHDITDGLSCSLNSCTDTDHIRYIVGDKSDNPTVKSISGWNTKAISVLRIKISK